MRVFTFFLLFFKLSICNRSFISLAEGLVNKKTNTREKIIAAP